MQLLQAEEFLALQLVWLLLQGQLPPASGASAQGVGSGVRINTTLKALDQTAILGSDNICTREEPYVEHIQVPEWQPVRVRTTTWCMEIPPRCATYKTEMRQVMKVQKLNKTRIVRFCCDGYEGNLSDSQAMCKPICRGGCGRGSCVRPDVCSCEEGYTSKHCTQRCDHDRWGMDCMNHCQCKNDAVCDNKTGICHCIAGWAGQFCEQPCPPGTYGIMCRKACSCTDKLCHPQTGSCISNHSVNVSHSMFETLNSTIANITHNLDHIAKRIGNLPASSNTEKPLPEVILIKQAVEEPQHTPKIILHQSSSELLDNLHSAAAAAAGKPADVIHVITGWPGANGTAIAGQQQHSSNSQLDLASLAAGTKRERDMANAPHQSSLLTTLLVILIIIMILITLGILIVYRRFHWNKVRVQHALGSGHNVNGTFVGATTTTNSPEVVLTEATLGKNFLKPLPELPRHTAASASHTNEAPPALYDTPSNNSSIKTPPYAYARKESLYSVASPKSRKGSLESHLYDEIRYHHQHQHQQHQHQLGQPNSSQHSYHSQLPHPHHHAQQKPQQQQQHRHYQHATTAAAYLPPVMPSPMHLNAVPHVNAAPNTHHVAHLIIPPQNSKFLQVPTHVTAHKIAHF